MKVTLHSHHTTSLLLSNEVRSTPWQDKIWDTSEVRWIQQGDARDLNNIETRAVKFFPARQFRAILTETSACFIPDQTKDLSAPV